MDRILLCLDGEPHTEEAVKWALELASRLSAEITAVHVKDPFLKQFYNDIYAQGREEYLDHVEQCLRAKAKQLVEDFEEAARAARVSWEVKVLAGDPIQELEREVRRGGYRLLLLGRKTCEGLAAWRSRDLPGKLVAAVKDVPVLLVPGGEQP